MKTKRLIILITACLFAAGSIINMHLAQNDHNTDFSLADISVMAQADGESGGGDIYCCQDFFDCKYDEGELCITCHDGDGSCSLWFDWTETCGLASRCTL